MAKIKAFQLLHVADTLRVTTQIARPTWFGFCFGICAWIFFLRFLNNLIDQEEIKFKFYVRFLHLLFKINYKFEKCTCFRLRSFQSVLTHTRHVWVFVKKITPTGYENPKKLTQKILIKFYFLLITWVKEKNTYGGKKCDKCAEEISLTVRHLELNRSQEAWWEMPCKYA